MPTITISGTPVNFPNTAASPIWSEAIIQFAQLVETALAGVTSTGDISKTSFSLTASDNPATNLTVTGLSFSSSIIRAAFIRYSVYRSTNSSSVSEAGNITIAYDANRSSGQKWEVTREYVGDAQITFDISDDGQFSVNTTAISGTSHSGLIYFTAQSTLQSTDSE